MSDEIIGHDALEFLQAVYQNPEIGLPVRMRAAAIAIEYERPALKATMVVAGGDFAQRLEAAIERSGVNPKLPTLINAEAEPLPPVGPEPTPLNAPFSAPRRRG